ncbi:MAG TPA: lipopolysaccharide heptosyltransferase II [Nitrospiraceae bacterium]|nr:MAG: lipopolysaccharide heptosyltransferase II [Nitrospirae bacterium GWA2_46_11]OGW24521.1 MAG: lipopolysaccharide heptosyltransferase II [Nitrospirae bacterium GWB2_47_37]HAK88692.1 lipopolysaccharide heptosyltransferase II [Nitrospiraceae bacterium]HCZ12020.1 lipopolysaccharide heptosyltransferase II [Nitrospiraceae bacterium]
MDKINLKKSPEKILVIKPSSLGDVVHSLPFLQAIKDGFPDAEIHWVIAKGLEGLLEDHPMVKKLKIINKDRWKDLKKIKDTASELAGISKELRHEAYDIAIDLQGLLRSGLLTYATGAPVRIGFKEAREGGSLFYTHKIRGGRDIHAVDRYLKIAAALGCKTEDIRFPMPLIKESDKVRRLKESAGDYAVIVPGARWETKKWSPEKFGRLAAMLDIKSIIIGSASDIEISEHIEAASKGKALSTAGDTDIKELISIIRGARYVVTNDSGPMHIAAALRIPVIAIFGPTNPERTGPYGNNHIIIRPDIPCAPCYKKKCKTMRCMEDISVERVYKEICGYRSS